MHKFLCENAQKSLCMKIFSDVRTSHTCFLSHCVYASEHLHTLSEWVKEIKKQFYINIETSPLHCYYSY